MPPLALDITPLSYPKDVRVLTRSPEFLVARRDTYGVGNKYQTNRQIKYWSTWFLLKALTTSGKIQAWTKQKEYILKWIRLCEKTFKSQLSWLQSQGLLTVDTKTNLISLASFRKAAAILGIPYTGTYTIGYKPKNENAKQNFRLLLIAEEFKQNQNMQAKAIMSKLERNPTSRQDLIFLLTAHGCDEKRLLLDSRYFIERLLQLQIRLFQKGSEFTSRAMIVRADINRGAKKIQEHHRYRSAQSVSYLKRKMLEAGIMQAKKIVVHSENRGRINYSTPDGSIKDGYKWVPRIKNTVWFLTDQLIFNVTHD
ncbi:hypothetical protein [Terrimonas pollutisoli]|uniref:hypothetical protein n=1 Tax=Terrimonas pollutisoli TaxID=3034147 RepID=UPI0023EDCBAF|nr:hypothetical protein [Terrimonas sp. H1YJ31]